MTNLHFHHAFRFVLLIGLLAIVGRLRAEPATAPASQPDDQPHVAAVTVKLRRIVYVCDASDAMREQLPFMKAELQKAIDPLRPVQAFNIIFYRDGGKALSFNPSGTLELATPANKKRAEEFIDPVSASGGADPLSALELAFKGDPDLVYLLAAGKFSDPSAAVAKVRELNADHHVKVNAIFLCDPSHVDAEAKRILKQIAVDSGGILRIVDSREH